MDKKWRGDFSRRRIMKYIGPRILKTGLTVLITTIIASFIAPTEGFVIIFTSIVALDNSVSSSVEGGVKRLINTAVGAVIATLMVYAGLPPEITIPVSVMALIIMSNKLGLKGSVGISGAVLIIILLARDRDPFMYSLIRLRDTLIGFAVAVLVNILILPPKLDDRLYVKAKKLSDDTMSLVNNVFMYRLNEDFDNYTGRIVNLSRELIKVRDELGFKKRISDGEFVVYKQLLSSLDKVKVYAESLSLMDKELKITRENSLGLKNLLGIELLDNYDLIESSETKDEILYNFVLDKIITHLGIIQSMSEELDHFNKVNLVKDDLKWQLRFTSKAKRLDEE